MQPLPLKALGSRSGAGKQCPGSCTPLDLVLPNRLTTPQPRFAAAAPPCSRWQVRPRDGSVPRSGPFRSNRGRGYVIPEEPGGGGGWSRACQGGTNPAGATCGGKRRARPGYPAGWGRENPPVGTSHRGRDGITPSLTFSEGCSDQKHEQRDEKPPVGRGQQAVPPPQRWSGAGEAVPKCPEVEPSAWSLTVLPPRDEHAHSNPVIYGCLSSGPPREPAPALLLPFSPSFSRGLPEAKPRPNISP